jgi:photosystem II stability/assembly factor-like uncharacterized protein
MKYFKEQRAFPFDRIPPGALQAAKQDYIQKWGPPDAARAQFNFNSWTAIGPDHISTSLTTSGRLNTIAVNPSNTNIIYAGGATGGVWKTTDGGTTWTALTDSQCSLAMGSITLDPTNPNIIYAGTGEENFSADSYYGCGVLKSIDGGASWTQLGAANFATTTGGAKIYQIAIHPTSTTTLMVASDFGLFRSTNGGASFTNVLNGVATGIEIDPSNPSVMYAALGDIFGAAANGVYKSTDGGATFPTKLAGGFPTANVGRVSLDIAASAPATLYAAVQNSSNFQLLGIFKSTNNGANWTQLTATGASCSNQCWYDMVIAVKPTDPNVVYFGGVSLFKSTDGGASFPNNITDGIHVDQHALVFDPTNAATVFAGNDGGIFKSTNEGGTWTSLNTNIAITQFYAGFSLHPSSAPIALGGTQDNHTLRHTGDPVWTSVPFQGVGGCDGGYTVIDFTTPTTQYAECQSGGSFSGPRRSDAGGSFVQKNNGITLADPALFIPPLVGSLSNSSTLYYGTNKVYRTTDKGENWAAISPVFPGNVSAIAQAPSNAQVIYVGTSSGSVQVTVNGGTNWTQITTGLPTRFVTDLAVHPTDPNTVFVVFSGFGTGHVFRSANAGGAWTNISGNLPDVPLNAIVIDPAAPTTEIFVGSDLGVFRTSNGGTNWTPFNTGLANVPVHDLVYNPTTTVLMAATHGRGVFQAVVGGGGGNTSIIAAVLPNARTTFFPGGPAVTGFATILNTGANVATSCSISLPSGVPAIFHYQTTNAQNQPIGTQDQPVNIPVSAGQQFVFSLTPTATLSQDIALVFDCANTSPAPVTPGVNTFLVSVGTSAITDMLSIGDTLTHDGIAHIPGVNGTGLLVTAAIDIGANGTATCAPTPTPPGQPARSLAANLSICETNAQGQCINPASPGASSTLNVTTNQTVFFSIFLQGQGQAISFDPANKRVFLVCSQGSTPVGDTSAAVCTGTVTPAACN